MTTWRPYILATATLALFVLLNHFVTFPEINIDLIGVVLTIASLLFGFLAGFFISELWSRYTEIRAAQAQRMSAGLSMIGFARHFYINKGFEKDFKSRVEQAAVADEIINWDEGEFELPYYRNVSASFGKVKIKTRKDEIHYEKLLDHQSVFVQSITQLDVLYRERLFGSEWLLLILLSVIISVSTLFVDAGHFFYQGLVFVFPAIIVLLLSIMYSLNNLTWSRDLVTLEPNQRLLEELGFRRFYSQKNVKYIRKGIKDFRTEADLKGDLKKLYKALQAFRKK